VEKFMEMLNDAIKPIDASIVADSLKVIARFTQAQRAHLAFINQDWRKMRTVFSWPDFTRGYSSLFSEIGLRIQMTPSESRAKDGGDLFQPGPDLWMQSSWWLQHMAGRNYVRFDDLDHLPDEVLGDVQRLKSDSVQTMGLMTLYDGKRLAGVLRLDNLPIGRDLSGMDIDLLQIASNLILQIVRASVDLEILRRDNAGLNYNMWHDEQTGLPNRLLFIEQLREVFRHKGQLFSVLLIELDCYSLIVHRYGEDIGQRLFEMALERIRSGLRISDFVARLEDDQMGILIVDLFEHNYAEKVAQRILNVFHTPFRVSGKDIGVTGSIGAAFPDVRESLPEVVLQKATIALRQARRSIKSRYMAFDMVMQEKLLERLDLENELRGSLERGNLLLHYQPITTVESGKLAGFEALVRWQHPTRGLIWPIEFIHLSEDTGLILPLGRWVLREACRQMRIWQETFRTEPPLVISVNISARQLEQKDFPSQVAEILRETGLSADSLRLEITESVLVDNSCEIVLGLKELRTLGVQLYIDDFGTGYSSLGYLDTLPADAIKIDRSFVNNLGKVKTSYGLVQAIIQMAHELNIDVVAEGVETPEQHDELRRLKCKYVQGFYVSQPLDSGQVAGYIRGGASIS
jgi:diguanylate cyclase (GGDEF)-like protein